YTLRITDNVTPSEGCEAIHTFTVNNDRDVITIENPDIALTDDANCSPDNGSAIVNEITVNGAGIGTTTGYSFAWFESDGTTPVAGAGNTATPAVDLAAGNYNVIATNTTTNCSSPITPFT